MTERSFFAELKRRNVIRVAIAYVAVSWLVLQAAALIFQMLELSNAISKGLFGLLLVGFIPAMVFSWIYELTPDGLKRESEIERDESITHLTGRRLDYLVIGVMAAVIGLLLVDKFVLSPRKAAPVAANATASAPVNPVPAQPAAVSEPTPPAAKPAPAQASIAVLPFVNMSSDKEQEFFSDGISEELLNLLAKITQLHVAARTSSFSFKGQNVEIPEIARRLHVAHVLEGSVRKSGEQVRITAQLIRAADGYHLWSQTYDRKLDDIFAIQDEISADVVKQLKVTLLGAAPAARQTDPKAYALYLEARQLGYQRTADALKKSDALYRQVLAIDPRYAPAWAGLSRNLINQTTIGELASHEAYPQARETAQKALAIDPDNAPAHAMLGRIANDQGDLAGAARHLESALALDPSDVSVLGTCAGLLDSLGRLGQAISVGEYAIARDPVNVRTLSNIGNLYRRAGRYDEAIAWSRTLLGLSPGYGVAHFNIGLALMLDGDSTGALAEIEQETSEFWRMIGLPMAYHALGRKTESDATLSALIAAGEKDGPYNIAYVHAFRGNADKAFEWLDKAAQYADPGLSEIAGEKLFLSLHEDPRWLPFLAKLGYAPEQLAKIKFEVNLPAEPQAETGAP